jgi:hypothetical protein
MASPTFETRNLHRIGTELGFLEGTLAQQPENKPEHLRAWVAWLRDMDKQWVGSSLSPRPRSNASYF